MPHPGLLHPELLPQGQATADLYLARSLSMISPIDAFRDSPRKGTSHFTGSGAQRPEVGTPQAVPRSLICGESPRGQLGAWSFWTLGLPGM